MSSLDERIIFWDFFEEKFITESERDKTAPPERYTSVYCQDGGVFVETWQVDNDKQLSIAYTAQIHYAGRVNQIRYNEADKHHVILKRMVRWGVPKEHYDKILEEV